MKALNDNELTIVAIRSTPVAFVVLLWNRPINRADHFPEWRIIQQGL